MLAEIMEVSRQLLVLLYESIALPGPCWQVICHQERGLSREAAAARLCCQPPLSRTLAALRIAIAGPPHAQLPLRQLSAPQRLGTHKGTGLCVCVATLHTGISVARATRSQPVLRLCNPGRSPETVIAASVAYFISVHWDVFLTCMRSCHVQLLI